MTDDVKAPDEVVLGASESPTALGLNPHMSPFRWQQIRRGLVDREPAGKGAEMGKRLEPVVLRSFVEDHDVEITVADGLAAMFADTEMRRTGLSVRHPTTRWMAASPDGVVAPGGMSHRFIERFGVDVQGGEHVAVEMKTTGFASEIHGSVLREKWGKPGSDAVPRNFLIQCHQQIEVIDADLRRQGKGYCDRAILRVLGPALPLVDYVIVRVPRVVAFILDEVGAIVRDNLIGGEPLPAKTVDDYELLAEIVGKAGLHKTTRPTTFDEDCAVSAWLEAKERRKAAELDEARERAAIIGAIGDGYGLESADGKVLYTFGSERERENPEAIVEEVKALAVKCRTAPWANPASASVADVIDDIVKRNTAITKTSGRRLLPPRTKEANE